MRICKKYDGREVKLLKGDFKGYYGAIIGTSANMDYVQVRLEGVSMGGVRTTSHIDNVRERL